MVPPRFVVHHVSINLHCASSTDAALNNSFCSLHDSHIGESFIFCTQRGYFAAGTSHTRSHKQSVCTCKGCLSWECEFEFFSVLRNTQHFRILSCGVALWKKMNPLLLATLWRHWFCDLHTSTGSLRVYSNLRRLWPNPNLLGFSPWLI